MLRRGKAENGWVYGSTDRYNGRISAGEYIS